MDELLQLKKEDQIGAQPAYNDGKNLITNDQIIQSTVNDYKQIFLFFIILLVYISIKGFSQQQIVPEDLLGNIKHRKCPQNYTVGYVWLGNKALPRQYRQYLQKCPNTTRLLNEIDYFKYADVWNNIASDQYKINIQRENFMIRVDLMKLWWVYFDKGIYSDFDTYVKQECYSDIETDQLIFSNWWSIQKQTRITIAQENFMMTTVKYNKQVRTMIQRMISEKNGKGIWRWTECQQRQCLMIYCQEHLYDRTWK